MTATIVKWGNSRGIRIPKPFLENLNMNDNDTVEITVNNNEIIIRKQENRKHKTLKERIESFYGEDFNTVVDSNLYEYDELDWGPPVGKEQW
jgi:antitoxin MazE